MLSLSSNSQDKYPKSKNDPDKKSIEIIRRIFKDFIQYEDGIDSYENKEAMKRALKSLPATINENELPLLINVWMYYDATDFPTRELITPIFIKNKKASVIAMKYRINHKKKWESKDSAPYSELIELEKDLELTGGKSFGFQHL